MVSSVTEGHIKKLRKAGYLSNDVAYWLPEKGQLIPTPRPHERVVFLPHFLRGLGFPLHPFVRGLMFYYGLCRGFVTADVLVKGLSRGAIATGLLEGVKADTKT